MIIDAVLSLNICQHLPYFSLNNFKLWSTDWVRVNDYDTHTHTKTITGLFIMLIYFPFHGYKKKEQNKLQEY